ncbi:hypothetical protein GBA52_024775 [Prunus armeniaca]|nr:hypothetical protein GBA52_024775 [Prunus armeniaca]
MTKRHTYKKGSRAIQIALAGEDEEHLFKHLMKAVEITAPKVVEVASSTPKLPQFWAGS